MYMVIDMANRKQRRKSKENYNDDYTQSAKSILITLGIVVVVFGLFYLITLLINNSKRGLNTKEPTEEVATIQYSEILGDDTFTMMPDEYYVLFYDFDGPSKTYYDYLFTQYASTEGNYIYKVDLSNAFNTKFASTETNKNASKAGELKVKDATLIKIKNGKNVEYVEGTSQVIAGALS